MRKVLPLLIVILICAGVSLREAQAQTDTPTPTQTYTPTFTPTSCAPATLTWSASYASIDPAFLISPAGAGVSGAGRWFDEADPDVMLDLGGWRMISQISFSARPPATLSQRPRV